MICMLLSLVILIYSMIIAIFIFLPLSYINDKLKLEWLYKFTKFLENILVENRIYKKGLYYIDKSSFIDDAKKELFNIMSGVTYKADISDATNYIDRILKSRKAKFLSKKDKIKIKKELEDYLFDDLVPLFRHRIAVL